ncbi:MAG TPA: hypothetical protein VHX40_05470, partial [Acidimicrobiales bacterium]|nr:hypothetical protein [Acidimicrobiales bacterium]
MAGLLALALAIGLFVGLSGGMSNGGHAPPTTAPANPVPQKNPRLDPDWTGSGKPVTFAFGGDVNFPSGSNLGDRLADDPATALGPTVPQLLSGATLTMVNLETALTQGTCPSPQVKTYVFYAPPTAVTALQHA